MHYNKVHEVNVETFNRRINRFNNLMKNQKKKNFVYINEDYLYDNNYRADEFNDKNFIEMLELEKFIKDKYLNIDFNIFYFNFKYHDIPVTSNIINIVLNTTTLYDNSENAPYEELRIFCGKILSELFNTNLEFISYDLDVFNT